MIYKFLTYPLYCHMTLSEGDLKRVQDINEIAKIRFTITAVN